MKKTLREPKRLTLERTTIALLSNPANKRVQGGNQWAGGYTQSTLPECDVTNTGTGFMVL
jgi:hypothetical protein